MIKHIAHLLNRLGKLFMVPQWSDENAVILAEWVFDNYKFESLATVQECLKNPPETFDELGRKETNWRLTPDRIQKWMQKRLEVVAVERENEVAKYKQDFKEELPMIDYEAYKKRIESGDALKEPVKDNGFNNADYLAFKAERERKIILEQGKNQTTDL